MVKALVLTLPIKEKKEFVSVNSFSHIFTKPLSEVFFMHLLSTILIILVLIVSLFSFFQKEFKVLRYFLPFLIIRTILELFSQRLENKNTNNLWLINLIMIISITFYLIILSSFIDNKNVKKTALWIGILIPIGFTFSCTFLIPLKDFHLIELSLASFILLSTCIYFFYELLSYPNDINLLKYPPFWIATGLLFNYAGIFPFFLFFRFIVRQSWPTVKSIQFMLDFLYIILNLLFIISFLCRLNLRKRSLSYS